MKKTTIFSLIGLIVFLLCLPRNSAAQESAITVKFQVTYSVSQDLYTALLIPDYTTPNANNNTSTEKSSTAQFTIVVPRNFVVTQVTDLKGTWSKPGDTGFQKFGPGNPGQSFPGLDQSLNYYVFGKTPNETDLGTFAPNVPIALFTFKGNGCFGPIKPLPTNDPFIQAADDQLSLNVANSFYSRSGQAPTGNPVPLQQFAGLAGTPALCCLPQLCVPITAVVIKQ